MSVGELDELSEWPLVAVALLLLVLCEYGGGGGKWRGCCWAAIKAIVLAYEGGSVVGTVGDELPFDSGAGGVVGGDWLLLLWLLPLLAVMELLLLFIAVGGNGCGLLC